MTNYKGSTGYGEAFAEHLGRPLRGPDDINDAADEVIRRFSFIYGGRHVLAARVTAGTSRTGCRRAPRATAPVSYAGLVNLNQWATSDVIYGREVTMGDLVERPGRVARTN